MPRKNILFCFFCQPYEIVCFLIPFVKSYIRVRKALPGQITQVGTYSFTIMNLGINYPEFWFLINYQYMKLYNLQVIMLMIIELSSMPETIISSKVIVFSGAMGLPSTVVS